MVEAAQRTTRKTGAGLMRAVVIPEVGPPSTLQVREVPTPEAGTGGVLVKVRACGTDAHDTALRAGQLKAEFFPGMVMGHEIAGDVVDVGPGVARFRAGDRVISKQTATCGQCRWCRRAQEVLCDSVVNINGGMADYVVLPEDSWVLIPKEVGYHQGAVLSCGIGTSYHAILAVGKVQPGENVLVTGAGGGLGLHAIQIAKLAGATVFALTTSPEKMETIRSAGADHVLSTRDTETPLHQQTDELTGGRGIDVVIDPVGAPVFRLAFRTMAKTARYVLAGQMLPEKIDFHPAFLFGKEQTIFGSNGTRRHELEEVVDLVAAGKLSPVISKVVPMEGAAALHELIEAGKSVGRVVVDPTL